MVCICFAIMMSWLYLISDPSVCLVVCLSVCICLSLSAPSLSFANFTVAILWWLSIQSAMLLSFSAVAGVAVAAAAAVAVLLLHSYSQL